jgi:hypothetical protein
LGSGGVASRPGRFTSRERADDTRWIGGWLDPRVVLDAAVKGKIPRLLLLLLLLLLMVVMMMMMMMMIAFTVYLTPREEG